MTDTHPHVQELDEPKSVLDGIWAKWPFHLESFSAYATALLRLALVTVLYTADTFPSLYTPTVRGSDIPSVFAVRSSWFMYMTKILVVLLGASREEDATSKNGHAVLSSRTAKKRFSCTFSSAYKKMVLMIYWPVCRLVAKPTIRTSEQLVLASPAAAVWENNHFPIFFSGAPEHSPPRDFSGSLRWRQRVCLFFIHRDLEWPERSFECTKTRYRNHMLCWDRQAKPLLSAGDAYKPLLPAAGARMRLDILCLRSFKMAAGATSIAFIFGRLCVCHWWIPRWPSTGNDALASKTSADKGAFSAARFRFILTCRGWSLGGDCVGVRRTSSLNAADPSESFGRPGPEPNRIFDSVWPHADRKTCLLKSGRSFVRYSTVFLS